MDDMGVKYEYEKGDVAISPAGGEDKVRYPRLDLEITKDTEDLLKNFPKSGEACITFKLKKLEIGSDYGPKNVKGRISLEVTGFEVTKGKTQDDEDSETVDMYVDDLLNGAATDSESE
jgi:hypothetical protein